MTKINELIKGIDKSYDAGIVVREATIEGEIFTTNYFAKVYEANGEIICFEPYVEQTHGRHYYNRQFIHDDMEVLMVNPL